MNIGKRYRCVDVMTDMGSNAGCSEFDFTFLMNGWNLFQRMNSNKEDKMKSKRNCKLKLKRVTLV